MLANTQAHLFNFSRFNSKSYNGVSCPYTASSNNSDILPSLYQLPIPNLNYNKLPPIKSKAQLLRVKPSSQRQQQQQKLSYKCTKCTKSFNRKNSLVRHERVHTGNKPYSCKVCNKRFTRKDILEGHKLSIKCQRRTQIYLDNIKSTKEENLMEEPSEVSSLPSSSTSSPVIQDSRRNSITCLLSSNSTDYYSQCFSTEQQWSPLRLPSLSETKDFNSSPYI